MTPAVVVDIGNSRMKWGRVAAGKIAQTLTFPLDNPEAWTNQLPAWQRDENPWLIASVVPRATRRFQEWLDGQGVGHRHLDNRSFLSSSIGFRTTVEEPEQIGIDRLLNSYAAYRFANHEGERPHAAVAISLGTAQTIDFVEPDGTHVGGAILPGLELMAKSLHDHTAALPLVALEFARYEPLTKLGLNTADAIRLGISRATLFAADGIIRDWAEPSRPFSIYVTGGGYKLFRDFIFSGSWTEVCLEPSLVLDGLRLAAEKLP